MFGIGKNSFLGIDIGTYSIKAVEIKVKNNKPTLTNYAWISLDDVKNKEHSTFDDTSWPTYLRRILKEAKIGSKNAYVSIPAAGALITLVEFPDVAREDLDQAIRFEAHKYIPASLSDVVLSWDVVSIKSKNQLVEKFSDKSKEEPISGKENKIQVILVAAPKKKVEKYSELISGINLKLKVLEIDSFSLVRSLVGNDQGNFVIVDIGSRICNIILVEKGLIKVNRNIDAGGRGVTRAIAKSFQIDEDKAAAMKTSGKEFLAGQTAVTMPVLDTIIEEIKRVLNDYYRSESGTQIESVILSGGTAGLNGITKYFQENLRIKTMVGNPFSRITYDEKLEVQIDKFKTQFSVCVGLALKGVEEYMRK
ncbi:MAG TPA: type IV pilus assembly protein PilM [Patescibacteria group bacterium]